MLLHMARRVHGRCVYLCLIAGRFRSLLAGGSLLVLGVSIYEHYGGVAVPWIVYGAIVTVCVLVACFEQGFEYHKRLEPRLCIAPVAHRQQWTDQSGRSCTAYHVDVRNDSAGVTIQRVKVRLTRTDPEIANLNWLPVPLHLKHDNVTPYQAEFTLNPKEIQQVDVVSAVEGAASFQIMHVVSGVNRDMPPQRHLLTITASGENVPPFDAQFEVCLDDQGRLRFSRLG